MDKDKEIYRFSKGIHIEQLKKDELKIILKDYYNIELPPNEYGTGKTDLKKLYLNALCTMLRNGYHIPTGYFRCEDPDIYYNDMIMMLYLYTINLAKPLPANQLAIAPETQTHLKKIEQSAFGAILGIRRSNNNIGNAPDDKLQRYELSKSVLQKIVDKDVTVENETKNTIHTVIRSEHGNKYLIPTACQNILIALIKSRKCNPFLFALSENKSDDVAVSLFKQCKMDNYLPYLQKKLQTALLNMKNARDLVSSDLYSFIIDKDNGEHYKFYELYKHKLDCTITKKEGTPHLKEADLYLSELLFAYEYYAYTIQQLNERMDLSHIDENIVTKFMDIVYNTSESMLCFSRKKHIDVYVEILKQNSEKDVEKDKLLRLLKKMDKTERYTRQKFGPALYYCFLYYIIDEVNRTSSHRHSELEKEVVKCFQEDFQLDLNQIKKQFSDGNMNSLLSKRRLKFLVPLKYSMEKALF